ncbi:MAG: LacI family DNA-binding transcriptional regulator [Lentisphaeria bacterium]
MIIFIENSGIKKIAQMTKSSICTVSLVLNGKADGRVSSKKQDEISKIAKKMNYRPSHSARILCGKKSYTIGIAMPRPLNSYYSKIIIAIQECFAQHGYMSFFVFWNSISDIPPVLESILSRDIDGLISWDYHECLEKENIPIVVLNHGSAKEVFDSVVIDYDMVYKNTVEYFIKLGHQDIAYFGIPGDNKEKLLRKHTAIHKIKFSVIPMPADSSQKQIIMAAKEYFNHKSPADIPKAVCALNDTAAICFRYVAEKNGLLIPRDISLIGFDNIDEAILFSSPLTTYDHCFNEMADKITTMLLSRIASPDLPIRKTIISPKFIERDSCRKIN